MHQASYPQNSQNYLSLNNDSCDNLQKLAPKIKNDSTSRKNPGDERQHVYAKKSLRKMIITDVLCQDLGMFDY